MLEPFIQAYCNGKMEVVFKLMVGEKDKDFRWKVILEEFSYLMKSEDGDHMLQLQFKILALKHDITFVQYACYYLNECNAIKKKHDPEVVERLCNIYPLDYSLPANIERVLVMVDTKIYEQEILEDEYKRIKPADDGKPAQVMTEQYFNKEIAALSKYQGYRLDKKTTSVLEYASAYQNLLTEIKNKGKDG